MKKATSLLASLAVGALFCGLTGCDSDDGDGDTPSSDMPVEPTQPPVPGGGSGGGDAGGDTPVPERNVCEAWSGDAEEMVLFYGDDGSENGAGIWRLEADESLCFVTPVRPETAGFLAFHHDGRFYFSGCAEDPCVERLAYTTDGTESGTIALTPPRVDAQPSEWIVYDNTLYFAAVDADVGRELWSTDGTAAGTQVAVDVRPGELGGFPRSTVIFDELLYFAASTPQGRSVLFRSDGSAEGTEIAIESLDLSGNPGAESIGFEETNYLPGNLFVWDDELYFLSFLWGHWLTDGTSETTRRIDDDGDTGFSCLIHTGPVVLDDQLYFAENLNSNIDGCELWRGGRIEESGALFADIQPGREGSDPRFLITAGETLYFSADGGDGAELWSSDGTSEGTLRVADLNPDGASDPVTLFASDDTVYFVADPGDGDRLYLTDGDGAEEVAPTATRPDPDDIDATPPILRRGSVVYFLGRSAEEGVELWATELETTSARRVTDLNAGSGDGVPAFFPVEEP